MSEPPAKSAAEDRLDSWKEIAAYLDRGARTVQRWEREEGLPVHRLLHDRLGSVYAYKAELDAWWASRQVSPPAETPAEEEAGPSIAVLPFKDMSAEKDQEYFCEGMAEEIINALGRVKGLRVASRTSTFRLKEGALDSREIGRRLRVSSVLEGSVRKSGVRLRITAQLTDAGGGYQSWSEKYDREMSDVFAIQDEIAQSIVGALAITLHPREQAQQRKAPTSNLQAYDFYLRGRKYYYQYGPRDIDCALQLFTRAIELDPSYALAHAGVADCWSYIYLNSQRSEHVRQQADVSSLRAVELDPESAQAQASRAVSLSLSGRNEEAEQRFETAIHLDPNLFEAHYFYARHRFALGQLEQAVELYEQAMRIHPDDFQAPLLVAQSYEDLGRKEEATRARQRGVKLAEQHLKWNPDDARAVYMAANGLAALGEREKARQWAERARSMRPDDPMLLYNVGCIYGLLEMTQEAIECLEQSVERGLSNRGWLEHDSNLDSVRGHQRFQALLRRLA